MSKRDIRWDALKHVEVDVHLGGAMVFIHPQSSGHFGQRRQQAPVNSDQAAQGLRVLTASSGENLLGQFRNELAKQIGVKTRAASLSEPRLAREQPRLCWIFPSWLACWMPRKLSTMGLK